jgi:hypothetical protein
VRIHVTTTISAARTCDDAVGSRRYNRLLLKPAMSLTVVFEGKDRVGDLGDLTQTADRVQGGELRIHLGRMHRRLDGAVRHCVYPDVGFAIFARG